MKIPTGSGHGMGLKKAVRFERHLRAGQWRRRDGLLYYLTLIVLFVGASGLLSYFKLLPMQKIPSVAAANAAEAISGRASIIDGDTIEIHGARIRLFGIDAPESGQTCLANGNPTRCGQRAAFMLADKISDHTVACEPKDRDSNGRIVAVCQVAGEDLNAWMVAQGWALAYRRFSNDYVALEESAKASKRGLWNLEFIPPWDWRQENARSVSPTLFKSAPNSASGPSNSAEIRNCNIKGNISQTGQRIYHVPGGEYYNQTGINEAKGERWFCSEAEAVAAGWRRSRR
jgi:endonuclease YncB( thermonuclease family)